MATFTYDVLSLADAWSSMSSVITTRKPSATCMRGGRHCRPRGQPKIIGERIRPDCLILIETTVPPGTTEYIAYPIIKKAFEKRGIADREPLLAHSFERVMPGRQYVSSIRDFWRVAAASTMRLGSE